MKKKDYSIFYNDTFKILLIIKESEIDLEDGKYSLLTLNDIGNKLSLTRQTIAKHIKILEENGYIENIKKKRFKITDAGYLAIKKMR